MVPANWRSNETPAQTLLARGGFTAAIPKASTPSSHIWSPGIFRVHKPWVYGLVIIFLSVETFYSHVQLYMKSHK